VSEILAPLMPVIIFCAQHPILVVLLPDGRAAAALHSFCDALQLDRSSQVKRIRRNPFLSKQLLQVPIITKGGWQQMDVIIVWAVPTWIGGLHLSKLTPEKQAIALAIQEKIVEAVETYFATVKAEPSTQPASDPPTPGPTQPGARTQRSYNSSWEMFYDALDGVKDAVDVAREAAQGIEQEQQARERLVDARLADLEAHQSSVELRLAQLEAGRQFTASDMQGEQRPGGDILSPQHLVQLSLLAHTLRARTGEPIKATYAELEEIFGVEHVSDIPDAGWEVVLFWFWRHRQQQG
jgi:hypothetical protein